MATIEAPVFRFGENVDTDVIVPGQYLKLSYDEVVPHVMAGIRPGFAQEVAETGGIILAGKNFGCGSSREAAPEALKRAGVKAVIAPFFARIFYRNAINVGLPVVECAACIASAIEEGEWITVNLDQGIIIRQRSNEQWSFPALPSHLQSILDAGGLVPYLKRYRSDRQGDMP